MKDITYCCMDCGDLICSATALYGKGRCLTCSLKYNIPNLLKRAFRVTTLNYCCQDCGNLISYPTALYGYGRCKSCSKKGQLNSSITGHRDNSGENNPAYKHGLSLIKHYCQECGKEICWRGVVDGAVCCQSCSSKGEKCNFYKDGRSLVQKVCIDCGKPIHYGNKRCRPCDNRFRWANPEYKQRVLTNMFKALAIFPNKPESVLINLLKTLKTNFQYVGDGKKIISGLIPDFIDEKNKLIIELYGDYWHKEKKNKNDIFRVEDYQKYGYKTLIIWEHELKNLDDVIDKIKEFVWTNYDLN